MDSNNTSSTKLDVYQIVTDRIIELLEKGTVPWQQPWTDAGIPMNVISKRPYRGINLWLLLSLEYERNLFLTWDQLKKLGGSVNKGEQGHVVVYWKITPKKDENDEGGKENKMRLLRYYKVFNIGQCRDLPANLMSKYQSDTSEVIEEKKDPIQSCDVIISGMPNCPPIEYNGQSAYYDIKRDLINMPKKKTFKSNEGYYSTLFHELVHSTGSEKRLNRPSITQMAEFTSELYSIEELIAELGAAYLSSFSGILTKSIKSSAAYIKGWLSKLRDDKKFVVQASGNAQRAVDYILNVQVQESPNGTEQPEVVEES
jgi:antirestriction protein ArdC